MVAQEAGRPAAPTRPIWEAMWMMLPPPAAIICGRTARLIRYGPVRLTARTFVPPGRRQLQDGAGRIIGGRAVDEDARRPARGDEAGDCYLPRPRSSHRTRSPPLSRPLPGSLASSLWPSLRIGRRSRRWPRPTRRRALSRARCRSRPRLPSRRDRRGEMPLIHRSVLSPNDCRVDFHMWNNFGRGLLVAATSTAQAGDRT